MAAIRPAILASGVSTMSSSFPVSSLSGTTSQSLSSKASASLAISGAASLAAFSNGRHARACWANSSPAACRRAAGSGTPRVSIHWAICCFSSSVSRSAKTIRRTSPAGTDSLPFGVCITTGSSASRTLSWLPSAIVTTTRRGSIAARGDSSSSSSAAIVQPGCWRAVARAKRSKTTRKDASLRIILAP